MIFFYLGRTKRQARMSITTSHMHTKGAPSGSALPVTILHNFISSLLNVICLPPWSYKLHAISLLTVGECYWLFSCLSLLVQVCIGNVVTEEKHNRPQSASLLPSFIHHIKGFLNAELLQAINATEL